MNVQARAFIVIRTTHFISFFCLGRESFFSLFICIMFYYFIFFIFCWIILLIRSTDLQHWVHANVTVLAHTWNRQVVLISMYLRLTRKLCLMYVIRWTCTEKKTTEIFYFILFRCFYVINGNNLCLICGDACFCRSYSIYSLTSRRPKAVLIAYYLAFVCVSK